MVNRSVAQAAGSFQHLSQWKARRVHLQPIDCFRPGEPLFFARYMLDSPMIIAHVNAPCFCLVSFFLILITHGTLKARLFRGRPIPKKKKRAAARNKPAPPQPLETVTTVTVKPSVGLQALQGTTVTLPLSLWVRPLRGG